MQEWSEWFQILESRGLNNNVDVKLTIYLDNEEAVHSTFFKDRDRHKRTWVRRREKVCGQSADRIQLQIT